LKAAPSFTLKLSGTSKVGRTLTLSGIPAGWKAAYQWLRAGVPIPGATKGSYKLANADAGRKVTARATISRSGYQNGTRTSAAKTVAKVTPKVTVKLNKPTVRRNADSFANITVSQSGVIPTGKIVLKAGRKSYTYDLTAADKGKLRIRIVNNAKGTYKIAATYLGNTQLNKKASKMIKLKVK
jgi:hypothetical protein